MTETTTETQQGLPNIPPDRQLFSAGRAAEMLGLSPGRLQAAMLAAGVSFVASRDETPYLDAHGVAAVKRVLRDRSDDQRRRNAERQRAKRAAAKDLTIPAATIDPHGDLKILCARVGARRLQGDDWGKLLEINPDALRAAAGREPEAGFSGHEVLRWVLEAGLPYRYTDLAHTMAHAYAWAIFRDDKTYDPDEVAEMCGLNPDFVWSCFGTWGDERIPGRDVREWLSENEHHIQWCPSMAVAADFLSRWPKRGV